MKKTIYILILLTTMVSCNSQIDLEKLNYDENVLVKLKDSKEIQKDQDAIYGLLSYKTDELEGFKFGEVSFSKYSMENGYDADYNDLQLYVDDYKTNKFLGFTIELVNQEECKKLTDYLKKKYGNPELHESSYSPEAYVWNNENLNQLILINHENRETRDGKKFLFLRCTIIKKGVRVENSSDSNVFTILDSFNLAHPKK